MPQNKIASSEALGAVRDWANGKFATASDLSSHTGNSTVHVTSTDKTNWDGKYSKPSGGIPETDLASAVQTKLNSVPADAETTTNKVTSLSSSSTNTQYPSAKCVYDSLPTSFQVLTGGEYTPEGLDGIETILASI